MDYFRQGTGDFQLYAVQCDPNVHRHLFDCMTNYECNSRNNIINADPGVRCSPNQVEAKIINISVTIVSGPSSEYVTALIVWKAQTFTVDKLTIYEVKCNSTNHNVAISVVDKAMSTHLGGLLYSSLYTCCVSDAYDVLNYTERRACTMFETPTKSLDDISISCSDSMSTQHRPNSILLTNILVTVGILGSIIIILLVFFSISVMCLLRKKGHRTK